MKTRKKMRKVLMVCSLLSIFCLAPVMSNSSNAALASAGQAIESVTTLKAYAAAQSSRWVGNGDSWKVSDNGGYLRNTWFQDDITGDWYLLGAGDGTLMYAGLITDQSTGKTYLLNTNHDGSYGKMISSDGLYNGVSVTFNQSHDGNFGCITSGLESLRAIGIQESSLAKIPVAGSGSVSGSQTQMAGDAGTENKEQQNTGGNSISDMFDIPDIDPNGTFGIGDMSNNAIITN